MKILGAGGPAGMIVICPATGVPSGYYRRFAQGAVARGFEVLLFNYDPSQGLEHWIKVQIPAVISAAQEQSSSGKVFVIGHSLGAQALGFSEVWNSVAAVIRVSASTGYVWRTRKPLVNAFRLLFLMPAFALLTGKLPRSISGLGTTLTRSQVLTWARWCGRPGYCHSAFLPPGDVLKISPPVHDIYAADDPYVTAATRADLNRFYAFSEHSEIELHEALGHVRFFSSDHEALWPHAFDKLSPQSS